MHVGAGVERRNNTWQQREGRRRVTDVTSCWFEIVERIMSLSRTIGWFILTLVAAQISQRRIWVLNITESWFFYVFFCTDILHRTPVSSLSLNHFAHMQFEKCLFVFPCMRGSMNFMRA